MRAVPLGPPKGELKENYGAILRCIQGHPQHVYLFRGCMPPEWVLPGVTRRAKPGGQGRDATQEDSPHRCWPCPACPEGTAHTLGDGARDRDERGAPRSKESVPLSGWLDTRGHDPLAEMRPLAGSRRSWTMSTHFKDSEAPFSGCSK